MIDPARKYPGTTLTIIGNFVDSDGLAIDPTTVKFRTHSPNGEIKSYDYATATISRTTIGAYNVDIVPDQGGLWEYRWEITSGTRALTPEGLFIVMTSRFVDDPARDTYRC